MAERLRENRVEVWYDEFSLHVGDSLRRSIDRGLAQSRFGIDILSPNFFGRQWSQWELDGLVARQNSGDQTVILPVWHGVAAEDIAAYSPPLADKFAARSDDGLESVVRRLVEAIHPRGSTLVIARDHLLDWGLHPPVVTDDWWLDVVSATDSNLMEGDFQEAMSWGRWGFPLPLRSTEPADRGWRIACAAMQRQWQEEASSRPITQITPPQQVLDFIASQPCLTETCHDYVRCLMSYAPQIVIRGFGGDFEAEIEAVYQASSERGEQRRAAVDPGGTALTVDGRAPGCDEEVALRHPEFGGYEAAYLACAFVQGELNGPEVSFYDTVEYVAWFLSDASLWLPAPVRDVLTRGMAAWGVWIWLSSNRRVEREFGFHDKPYTGAFGEAVQLARTRKSLRLSSRARRDLVDRLSLSTELLRLPEDGSALADRLMTSDFLDAYFEGKARRSSCRQSSG